MDIQLQELIDKIKKDGVATAEQQASKIIEEAETNGCAPSKFATTVLKLVEKKNPPFRTLTGPLPQVMFAKVKGWLPGKFIRYALRTFYKIKK